MASRLADTRRFYGLLDELASRTGGPRRLAECSGRMDWPRRGVYFFFEPRESRAGSKLGLRVVRIGTHALTVGARSTLWGRLAQHRGTATGSGNHRTSIFRLLVGAALASRGDIGLPPSWGAGSDRGAAASRLGLDRDAIKIAEADLEARVSDTIGAMPFLWLPVDDEPGPQSQRGLVERNAIALLSGYHASAPGSPTPDWLGQFADRDQVRRSGLWNSNHVADDYDRAFLDVFERLIGLVVT